MDHVLARIKRLQKTPFVKLVSDHTLYNEITITNQIPYSPIHNLDEDSWFVINEFTKQPFCIDLLQNSFDSKDYANIRKDQFRNIDYIFSIQGSDFYFQNITPSLFIKKKTICFGNVATIQKNCHYLTINDQPDAIYFKNSNCLAFRNLSAITGIFNGIDSLYKEATTEETNAFLQNKFICLKNNYNVDKVSKPNRKRIALAMDALKKISKTDRDQIIAYTLEYCGEKLKSNPESKAIEISTDDELKFLLYGIDQRFYTTLIGKEKRLANSVLTME